MAIQGTPALHCRIFTFLLLLPFSLIAFVTMNLYGIGGCRCYRDFIRFSIMKDHALINVKVRLFNSVLFFGRFIRF